MIKHVREFLTVEIEIDGISAMKWNQTWEDVPLVKEFTNNMAFERHAIDGKRSYLYINTEEGEKMVTRDVWIIKDENDKLYLRERMEL